MSGRVDRLSENSLIRRITDARRALRELRTNPQRFGSKSVRLYRTFTPNAYDFEVQNVGYNNRIVEVVFTPANSGPQLGGVFRFEYTVEYSSTGNPVDAYQEDFLPTQSGPSRFRLHLSSNDNFPNSWARIKVWVYSNSSGTISYTLV